MATGTHSTEKHDHHPHDWDSPDYIRGTGYGALTKFLLDRFPKATAVCQDGSQKMAKLGRRL